MTILIYLDSPIPTTPARAADVFFILTAETSPLCGRWWRELLPLPRIYVALAEGTLKPYLRLWVNIEKLSQD